MHTAQTYDLPELTEHARALELEVLNNQDPLKLLQVITQLSELCRTAQNTHQHSSFLKNWRYLDGRTPARGFTPV